MASASDLDVGNYFLLNNEPVKVIKKEVVIFGTHSHSKLKFYIKPLLGGGEKSVTMGHSDKVEVLDITKKTGQVISKIQNKVQVMDIKTYETFDAEVSDELFDQLNENDEVIFVDYLGNAKVLEKKR